jgi:hypothetical protein
LLSNKQNAIYDRLGSTGVDVIIHTAVFFVRTPCSLAEVLTFGKNILPLP